MVNYLIVRSYWKTELVSVSTTENFFEHFLKFRDNEIYLQQNLYIALVPYNYDISKELSQNLKFKCDSDSFYYKEILEQLPNDKLVITKKINTHLRLYMMVEKLLNIRYKYNNITEEIDIDYH